MNEFELRKLLEEKYFNKIFDKLAELEKRIAELEKKAI